MIALSKAPDLRVGLTPGFYFLLLTFKQDLFKEHFTLSFNREKNGQKFLITN